MRLERVFCGVVIALAVQLFAAAGLMAQTTAMSSAFGQSASLNLLPLFGSGIPIGGSPMPTVSGAAPPAFNQSGNLPSSGISTALTGTILGSGSILVHASSGVPGADTAAADATVHNLAFRLGQLVSQLNLGADLAASTASLTGSCAGGPVASGTTTLTNGRLSGTLAGGGLNLPASPAPNTVLLNNPGVRIVANEQIPTTTPGVQGLTVNALHFTLSSLGLTGIGALSGDVVIAQSHAEIHCGATPVGADLSLTQQVSLNPVPLGGTLTYTITVANAGPSAAAQTVLTDPLPASVTWLATHSSQGSCSGTASVLCNLGTIPVGGHAVVSVDVRANLLGLLIDTATVASATADPNPADNQATATTTVQGGGPGPQADLAVMVAANADPVQVDQIVTYTLQVLNRGPNPATGVSLSQLVPDRCDPVSTVPSQGSCSSATSCNLGDLAAGQSAEVTLALRLHEPGSNLFHTAATSGVADPDLSNNQAARTVTVELPTGGGPGGGSKGACEVDAVPAATLLYPYFQVDLSRGDGVTTLFSITNAFAAPRLTQVTLWTDWGVPTLTFPVYLTGFDVQTFNLRDLIVGGRTPQTGVTLSPTGSFSADSTNFPGCATGTSVAAPLKAVEVAHLQAWHTGARSPLTDTCAASPSPDGVAVGYITVDVVRSCSALTPADPGYFGPNGVAADDNVLFGDFMFIDPVARSAKGDLAVHVVAEPGVYKAGDYTFYGRYVNGDASDQRRPLGTRYATRFLAGGNFAANTHLLVWRDTKAPPAKNGLPCGQQPTWAPLAQSGVTVFDEQENAQALAASTTRVGLAVQLLKIGDAALPVPSPFGWLMLDLGHSSNLFGNVAQGWVITLIAADGRFTSISERAIRLGTACTGY
ncbi:MAG TPA: DUF11 domain-containing protein [Thermoanaerobaculia bacterium]|nr:DUF11 domain-containing protein [Thermoanaerobaculia bacterium]